MGNDFKLRACIFIKVEITLTRTPKTSAMAPELCVFIERARTLSIREPIAFLSYVRNDDDHDGGRITQFRQRLEGEVRMQTGKAFPIFQDRNDLSWGQRWSERIEQSLNDVTFLIPIITPSFFESPACRSEFEIFLKKEKLLGMNNLILPIYYVTSDQMDGRYKTESDVVVNTLSERQWTDWRDFRFKPFSDENVGSAMAKLGHSIKGAIGELAAIRQAAEKTPTPIGEGQAELIRAEYVFSSDPTDIEEIRPYRSSKPSKRSLSADHYHAYTKRFDEIVRADELAEPPDIARLFSLVEKNALLLREEHSDEIRDIADNIASLCAVDKPAVSFLADNSGSLRGEPVVKMSAWLTIITDILAKNEVRFEVNGFTTRTWKGGQSRELWIRDGKPNNPGRLNDLRFVIYKSLGDQPSSLRNLGLMLRDGLLKENIDGESLSWAYRRMRTVEERRKFLIVLSDGSPVDDSTQSSNSALYLDKHLRDVIDYIDFAGDVNLSAVGLGHDVTRLYGQNSIGSDASRFGIDLGRVLINALRHGSPD